jgi:hypothetical protein
MNGRVRRTAFSGVTRPNPTVPDSLSAVKIDATEEVITKSTLRGEGARKKAVKLDEAE